MLIVNSHQSNSSTSETVQVLNLQLDNLTMRELLEQLRYGIVFTPNVDHLIKLQRNYEFLQAYRAADYKVCDSKILQFASFFLGTPIREKVSGSDLFPAFYKYHQHNEDIKIFLLGSSAGVAEEAMRRINLKVGRQMVIASYSPSFGFEKNENECLEIVELINQSQATVLAIGVGAPKQEIWIWKYKHLLPKIKIFLAVGATIDFEAGDKQRAPKWMSESGLEWVYRLLGEPKRLWKRYLIDALPFFLLLLMQKIKVYKAPF